ncbi:MAG: thioredoxin domain-containing protein [Candidatus Coatesbacteria bacterium]|nr:thioredoxin domain-containing protein [Candidatus Coatesbacteria bacterium]
MRFDRNNLDRANSPYLRQHKDNPVHWQEWLPEVLEHAKAAGKPLFVSVGYATCHWCHVMAHESFQNEEAAAYLNKHYVAIKVDKEQRPDIDQYLMSFLMQTQGQGGWPLNVFMTPDARPFLAVTYIPPEPRHGMPSFIEALRLALEFCESRGSEIARYIMQQQKAPEMRGGDFIDIINAHYDREYGGFGAGHKFPPHCTLLYLLHLFEATGVGAARAMLVGTLDTMAIRGLHDHLQGGFYRYCVDRAWTIPHFEKMLYDQAMLLWVYSAAFKVLKKDAYRTIAVMLIKCLCETFEQGGLFLSAHDADTEGREGETYLWTMQDLDEVLTADELDQFEQLYEVTEGGNFEGKNHLIMTRLAFLPEIEQKLLSMRKERAQPFVDMKLVTGWNALAGIGLLMADRLAGISEAKALAIGVFDGLMERHFRDGRLVHSSLGPDLQTDEFLNDYAAMLLFATYLHEETGSHSETIRTLREKMMGFKSDDGWLEARNADFMPVPAQEFDHPTPSSVALAEMALLRANIMLGEEYLPMSYRQPLASDFYNTAAMVAGGDFHVIHSPKRLPWAKLPLNCMQVRSESIADCFGGRCREFDSVEALLAAMGVTGAEEAW